MNTDELDRRFLLGGLAGAAGISALAAMAKGGPLNPPAGPVAPTGKTITEAEPRTPVNATTCPGDAFNRFIISQPGSYYLTSDVTASGNATAILIFANCTLDLNGFRVFGGPGAHSSIVITGAVNVCVRNGQLSGPGAVAQLGAADGIGMGLVFEDLRVVGVTGSGPISGHGFYLQGTAAIRNCSIDGCAANGMYLMGPTVVENCQVRGASQAGIVLSSGAGSVVRGCVVSDCAGGGIRSLANATSFGYSRISANLVRNSGTGIYCGCNGCIVEDNVLQQNSATGVQCPDTGNVVVRNIVTGSAAAFALASGNRYGQIMNIPGAGTAAVNGNSAASTMGSVDPSANFVF